jgi:MYXO-CTERM domain-containing protein
VVLGTTVAACVASEHLSQTGEKSVVFMPSTSYDFGVVAEFSNNTTNPDPYFVIRAQGSSDSDYVTNIQLKPSCGSDFALDMAPPTPFHVYCDSGASGGPVGPVTGSGTTGGCTYVDYTFGAVFHPSQAGSQSCEVDVTIMPASGSGSGCNAPPMPVFLYGSASAATYSMNVSPPLLDFGDIPLNGTSGQQTFNVIDNGGTPIIVTGVNSDPTHFSITPLPTGPFTLNPNGSQPFSVKCTAGNMPQAYTATVMFTTSPSQGSLSKSVTLKCNAAATTITASPTPVNLGTHLIGDGGSTVPVMLQNTGTASVTLDNFRFSGTPGTEVTYPGAAGSFTLAPTMSALVSVQYVPMTERDFGSLGLMMFDANGSPTSVPLVGGAHTGSIGTNPAALDFGAVCAGSSPKLDLAVFANAGGDVNLTGDSGPGAPFMSPFPGATTLMAHHGNEATITTTAATTANTPPGDVTQTLQLVTNIPNQSMVPINVHALVLAGGVSPDKSVVHFGPNDLGKPSPVQMITLTNCGSSDLMLSDVSLAGSNSDEFAIVSPADVHVTIPTTKSQQFLVIMNPKTAGAKSAELDFIYAGGMSAVALDGTGLGGVGTGSTKDRETYYACSVGTPGGLMPLAVAGLLLRRRRRR